MLLKTHYQQQENKIYIYDDLNSNNLYSSPSNQTYNSEADDGGYCESCDSSQNSQSNFKQQRKQAPDSDQFPLYTIYEGGSSVDSGQNSFVMNNSTSMQYTMHTQQRILKTESEYQQFHQQYMNQNNTQQHNHQYLQTCVSNNSHQHYYDNMNNCFVYEVKMKKQNAQTPHPPATANQTNGSPFNFTSARNPQMFDSGERKQVMKGSSSRYRYDSVEDQDDDDYYNEDEEAPRQDEEQVSVINNNQQKNQLKFLDYFSAATNLQESSDKLTVVSFPVNLHGNTDCEVIDTETSNTDTIAEISIAQSLLNTYGFNNNQVQDQTIYLSNEQQNRIITNVIQKVRQLSHNTVASTVQEDIVDSDDIDDYSSDYESSFIETAQNAGHNLFTRRVFRDKLPQMTRMPQMKGDDEVTSSDDPLDSILRTSQLELRDPNTNEVFLRTSFREAQRHLRKISKIINNNGMSNTHDGLVGQKLMRGSQEQGQTEESEVLDSERQTIAGQRISVIKSILQKMLFVQRNSEQFTSNVNIPWSPQEMLALTDIFKNIVHSEIEQKNNSTLNNTAPLAHVAAKSKVTSYSSYIISSNNNDIIESSQEKENIKVIELEKQNLELTLQVQQLKEQLNKTLTQSPQNASKNERFSDAECLIISRNFDANKTGNKTEIVGNKLQPICGNNNRCQSTNSFYKQCDSCGGGVKNCKQSRITSSKQTVDQVKGKLNFHTLQKPSLSGSNTAFTNAKQSSSTTYRESFTDRNTGDSSKLNSKRVKSPTILTSAGQSTQKTSVTNSKRQSILYNNNSTKANPSKVTSFLRQ